MALVPVSVIPRVRPTPEETIWVPLPYPPLWYRARIQEHLNRFFESNFCRSLLSMTFGHSSLPGVLTRIRIAWKLIGRKKKTNFKPGLKSSLSGKHPSWMDGLAQNEIGGSAMLTSFELSS